MRSAFDSAPDARVIVDACDTIVFANDRASSLFGHEVNEIQSTAQIKRRVVS
jgi:hypothetical protein